MAVSISYLSFPEASLDLGGPAQPPSSKSALQASLLTSLDQGRSFPALSLQEHHWYGLQWGLP